jgi:hypothetical protein
METRYQARYGVRPVSGSDGRRFLIHKENHEMPSLCARKIKMDGQKGISDSPRTL